jgi:hypothetical protein
VFRLQPDYLFDGCTTAKSFKRFGNNITETRYLKELTVLFRDTYLSDLTPNILSTKLAKSDHILSRVFLVQGKAGKTTRTAKASRWNLLCIKTT